MDKTSTINWSAPCYFLEEGKEPVRVQILTTERPNPTYPVVVLFDDGRLGSFTSDGRNIPNGKVQIQNEPKPSEPLDWTKPCYYDNEVSPLIVLTTTRPSSPYSVICHSSGGSIRTFTYDGRVLQTGEVRVRNRPKPAIESPRLSGFLNVYPERSIWHKTKERADQNAGASRKACIALSEFPISYDR